MTLALAAILACGDARHRLLAFMRIRREQWCSEGVPASLARRNHARYGVTAPLAGALFEQRFEVLARDGEGVRTLARAQTVDRSQAVVAVVAAPAEAAA